MCEKGHIAGEQSSRNWGWCRKMGRDPREFPLIIESLRLWQGMNEMVEAETGFRQAGIMYLAESQAELGQLEAWLEHARQYQLDTRLIGRAEAARADARSDRQPWTGALYTAERRQGRAAEGGAGDRRGGAAAWRRDPHPVRRARHRDRRRTRVAAAVTEKGRIACDTVVLAGGAWCRLFCGNLGIELPQLKVLATVMRTEPLEGGPEISASGGLFGFRKRMDGGYTVATLGVRTIDLVPDNFRLFPRLPAGGAAALEEAAVPGRPPLGRGVAHAAALGPGRGFALRGGAGARSRTRPVRRRPRAGRHRRGVSGIPQRAVVAESWGGMIDVMPDAIPVISPVESLPGFFIATGFSGHGFGIGPGAGKLVADMVAGDPTLVDPAPFRLSRFTDGSNPRPHPLAS